MSRPRGSPREINAWLRRLVRDGYTVYIARGSGHWHIRSKDGRLLTTVSVSPRDARGCLRQAQRNLARAEAKMKEEAAA